MSNAKNANVNSASQKLSIQFVDQLRGFAVLSVFAFHSLGVSFGTDSQGWAGNFRDFGSVTRAFYLFLPLALGSYGVAVFFVISGFCIHLSYERSSKSWLDYAGRRFFRIYPPYLLALFAIVMGALAFGSHVTSRDAISHLFLIHNLTEDTFFTINPSFWSIATEVQLYILYPLLYLLAMRIGWSRVCAICLTIEIVLRLVRGICNDCMPTWFVESPITYAGSWVLGAWAADKYIHGTTTRTSSFVFVYLALLLVGCYYTKPLSHVAFTVAATMTFVLLQNRIGAASAMPTTLMQYLGHVGVISFSIYLFHQPILRTVGVLLSSIYPSIHPVLTMAACGCTLIPVIALSYFTYRFVEVPSAAFYKVFKTKRSTPNYSDAKNVDPTTPSGSTPKA